MSSPSQPAHLSHHQRNTLRQIFQHPAGHNIEWRAVLSLLGAVGSADQRYHGKVAVTIGSQTEYFDPPRHKDIGTQAVVNLRHAGQGRLPSRPCGYQSQRPAGLTRTRLPASAWPPVPFLYPEPGARREPPALHEEFPHLHGPLP